MPYFCRLPSSTGNMPACLCGAVSASIFPIAKPCLMRVSHGGGQQLLLWRHRAGSHAECWQIDMTASSKEEVFSKLLAGRIDIAVAYGTSCNRWMPMPGLQSQVVALRQPRWLIGDFYLGFSRKAMSAGRIDAYVVRWALPAKPGLPATGTKYNMKSFLP
jgi:hypothetical protein